MNDRLKDRTVSIFEVGPRDGLQNEKKKIPLKDKLWFVKALSQAGVREIEAGAFVRSDRVPQMAESEMVFKKAKPEADTTLWALVPNRKGLERAVESNIFQICLFTASSDAFNKANIGMTIEDSFREYDRVFEEIERLKQKHSLSVRVKGYVSTAFGCPYQGYIAAEKTLQVLARLAQYPIDRLCIGDTIGVGTPRHVDQVLRPAIESYGPERLGVHFHDTRGTALANAYHAYELGIRQFDTSAGGLGGCPYAPGASGNLATEDLVYLFEGMGIHTGIDLKKLCQLSIKLSEKMKRKIPSRVVTAFQASKKNPDWIRQ